MSCGCGKLPKGTFSPQKYTWSPRTSLGNDNWDPYPELEKESYCGCGIKSYSGSGPCRCPKSCPCKGSCQGICKCATNEGYCSSASDYRTQTNVVGANYAPLQYNVSFKAAMLAPMSKESFVYYSNAAKPTAYQVLKDSWAPQATYQL